MHNRMLVVTVSSDLNPRLLNAPIKTHTKTTKNLSKERFFNALVGVTGFEPAAT